MARTQSAGKALSVLLSLASVASAVHHDVIAAPSITDVSAGSAIRRAALRYDQLTHDRVNRQLNHRFGLVDSLPPTRRRPIVLPPTDNPVKQYYQHYQDRYTPETIEEVRYADLADETSSGGFANLRAPVVTGGYSNTKVQGYGAASGYRAPQRYSPAPAPSWTTPATTRPPRAEKATTRPPRAEKATTRPPRVEKVATAAPAVHQQAAIADASRRGAEPEPVPEAEAVTMLEMETEAETALETRRQAGRVPLHQKLTSGMRPGAVRTRQKVPYIPRATITATPLTVTSSPASQPTGQSQREPMRSSETRQTQAVHKENNPETYYHEQGTGSNHQEYTTGNHYHEQGTGSNHQEYTTGNHYQENTAGSQYHKENTRSQNNQANTGSQHHQGTTGGPYHEDTAGNQYHENTAGNRNHEDTTGNQYHGDTRVNHQQQVPQRERYAPERGAGDATGQPSAQLSAPHTAARPAAQPSAVHWVTPGDAIERHQLFHASAVDYWSGTPQSYPAAPAGEYYSAPGALGVTPGQPGGGPGGQADGGPGALRPFVTAPRPPATDKVRPSFRPPPRRPPVTRAPSVGYLDSFLSWFRSGSEDDRGAPGGSAWHRQRPAADRLGAGYVPADATDELDTDRPAETDQLAVSSWRQAMRPEPAEEGPNILPQFRPNAPGQQLFPQQVLPPRRHQGGGGQRRPQPARAPPRRPQPPAKLKRRPPAAGDSQRRPPNSPPPRRPQTDGERRRPSAAGDAGRRPHAKPPKSARPQRGEAQRRPLLSNEVQRRRGEPEPALGGSRLSTLQMLHPGLSKPSVMQQLPPAPPRRPHRPAPPLRRRPLPPRPAAQQLPPPLRERPLFRPPPMPRPGPGQSQGPLQTQVQVQRQVQRKAQLQGQLQGQLLPTARPATLMDDRRIMVVGPFQEPPPGAPYIPHPELDPAAAAIVADQVQALRAAAPAASDMAPAPAAAAPADGFGGLRQAARRQDEAAVAHGDMFGEEDDLLPISIAPTAEPPREAAPQRTAAADDRRQPATATADSRRQPTSHAETKGRHVQLASAVLAVQAVGRLAGGSTVEGRRPAAGTGRGEADREGTTGESGAVESVPEPTPKSMPEPSPEPEPEPTPRPAERVSTQFVYATNANSPILTQTFATRPPPVGSEQQHDQAEADQRHRRPETYGEERETSGGRERVVTARLVADPPDRAPARAPVPPARTPDRQQEWRLVGGEVDVQAQDNVLGYVDEPTPTFAISRVENAATTTVATTTTAQTTTTTTTAASTTTTTTAPTTTRPPTTARRPTTSRPHASTRRWVTMATHAPAPYDVVTAGHTFDGQRDVMTIEVTHRSSYAVGPVAPPSGGGVGSVTSVDLGAADARFDSPEVTYYTPPARRASEGSYVRSPQTSAGVSRADVGSRPAPGKVRSPVEFTLPELYQGFQALLD